MKRIQGALRNRGLLYFYMSTSKDIIYYTDNHRVDEDNLTISVHGGNWLYEAGIACRFVVDASTNYYVHVASSNMQNM